MRQIAPGGQQFVVVLAPEVVPGEVGVPVLGGVHREVVAQRIGIVPLQIVGQPHGEVAAHREFLTFQVEILVGRDVVGQVEVAIPHKHGRPDDGVKGDVVLADEVVATGGMLPPLPPLLGVALVLSPLDAGREVADHRLEPHVDTFVLVALQGHLDAPRHVPGYRAGAKAVSQHIHGEVEDVRAPVPLVLQPLRQPLGEGREVQEEMLCFPDHGGAAVELAAGLDQFRGVQGPPAIVTLVTSGVVEAAQGAGALHVPVGQKAVLLLAVQLPHHVLEDVAVLQEPEEHVLRHVAMVQGVGVGEEVEAEAQLCETGQEAAVVAQEQLLGRDALLFGGEGDGSAMGVGA